MPSQTLADAAHVVQYPAQTAQHHVQLSSALQDASTSTRQRETKTPRGRSNMRPERPPRSDDEIKFNVGVPKSRPPRRKRPALLQSDSRLREERYHTNESPPGYEEAISTPCVSGCSSTVTLVTPNAAHTQPAGPSTLAISTTQVPQPSGHPIGSSRPESPHPPGSPGSETDSEGGIEIIHGPEEDTERREGITQPHLAPGSSPYSQASFANSTQVEILTNGQPGRPKDAKPKRRNNTLSPLRILFPTKASAATQDVIHSAHPSPNSPYSDLHGTASPFRSTISLKASLSTLSLGRFNSTDYPIQKDRKLFSFKGKQRAKAEETAIETETKSCDGWEIIVPAGTEVEKEVEAAVGDHTPSLMTTVEQIRSRPFTDGHTPRPIPQEAQVPVPQLTPASPVPSSTRSTFSRDEKVREMFMTLNARRPPANHAPTPRSPSPIPEPQVMSGPIVTTVRTRKHPSQPPSPKTETSTIPFAPAPYNDHAELQRALDTPLPATPVMEPSYFGHVPGSSSRPSSERSVSRRPSPRPSITVAQEIHANDLQSSQTLTISQDSDTFFGSRPVTPVFGVLSTSESMSINSLMRHHYPGRPLPRPPASRTPRVVDSAYAPPFGFDVDVNKEPVCPEGLLIDFDDETTENQDSESGRVSVHTESMPPTPASSSFTMSTTSTPTISPPVSPVDTIIPTSEEPAPGNQAHNEPRVNAMFHPEYTELDVLVNGLDPNARDGENYDALLLVSEFVGPAHIGSALPSRSNLYEDSCVLQGRVEVDRRRITRMGKRKLKLSLLGVGVERCAICLSQFKEAEHASLISKCQHSFHARCIGTWASQGTRTCPICRTKLDGSDS
ncbi:hypothetical protein EYR40_010979 [Pleurotus pulmonarius]|nr:hypothetical protein EYR36_002748 [Pleurotus pulmonarius]KAF4586961.1 hypothetical protein EYR40_010979 [Pleurotus pulmonarius]